MARHKKDNAFTLIELLVVLAIIAIMASAMFVIYSEARAKSRDARRVQDIYSLHLALSIYANKNGVFPANPGPPSIVIDGSDVVTLALTDPANPIIPTKIIDPMDNQIINGETFHYYYYTQNNAHLYTITYCLETDYVAGLNKGCNNSATY